MLGGGFMIGGACLGIMGWLGIGIGGGACVFRMKRYSSSPRGLPDLRESRPNPTATIAVNIISIANCSYVI
jgi:uncharacterized membrane-anchored protein